MVGPMEMQTEIILKHDYDEPGKKEVLFDSIEETIL